MTAKIPKLPEKIESREELTDAIHAIVSHVYYGVLERKSMIEDAGIILQAGFMAQQIANKIYGNLDD